MSIRIIPFENKYLEEMVRLFVKVYSDEEGKYPLDMAKSRLEDDLKTGRKYSFIALEGEVFIGGIVCKIIWAEKGRELFVDTVQVDPAHQKSGAGTLLMKAAVVAAKVDGITTACFIVDTTSPFPGSWYQKLGFKKTNYALYWGETGVLGTGK
jgi:GNAT superfamily N-acetyltransferase